MALEQDVLESKIVAHIMDMGSYYEDEEMSWDARWVLENVPEGAFLMRECRRAFVACRELCEEGLPWDAPGALVRLGEDRGGVEVLNAVLGLSEGASGAFSATLRSGVQWLLRRHEKMFVENLASVANVEEARKAANSYSDALQRPFAAKEVTNPASEAILQLRLAQEGSAAFETGYWDLDRILNGGFHRGHLTIIGARPAHGKTALLVNLLSEVVQKNRKCLFVSLEMAPHEIMTRLACLRVGADLRAVKLRGDRLADVEEQLGSLARAEGLKLVSCPTPSSLRRAVMEHAPDLVFLDYLQLMQDGGSRAHGRVQEVSAISRQLKLLSQEADTAMIAACQLNRLSEGTPNGEPALSHLRDSGAIEQDADEVFLLYNPVQAHRSRGGGPAMPLDPSLKVICAKNRHGETGTVRLQFDMPTQRILPARVVSLNPHTRESSAS